MCIDWFYWIKWKNFQFFSPRLASNCWAFIENISYKKIDVQLIFSAYMRVNEWMFGFYSITKHTERVIDIFRQYVGEMKSYVMQNIMDSLASPAIVDGLEFIETWNTPIESNRIILAYSFSCGRHPRWIGFFFSFSLTLHRRFFRTFILVAYYVPLVKFISYAFLTTSWSSRLNHRICWNATQGLVLKRLASCCVTLFGRCAFF